MALRATNRHEKRPESLLQPIWYTGLVKVGAAIGRSGPLLFLDAAEIGEFRFERLGIDFNKAVSLASV